MQAISKVEGRVSCIPNNTEKYVSFSLGQLRFIDSAQFLLASLRKPVAASPPEAFQLTAQHKPDRERRELLWGRVWILTSTWTPGIASPSPLLTKEVFYSKLSDAYQWRGLHPCAKGLGDLWVHLSARLQRPLLPDRHAPTDRCLWDVPEDVPPPVRSGPCSLLLQPGALLGRPAQEDRLWARTAYRLRPASVHWEGDAMRHLNGLEAPCLSQQSSRRGLWPRDA